MAALTPYSDGFEEQLLSTLVEKFGGMFTKLKTDMEAQFKAACDLGAMNAGKRPVMTAKTVNSVDPHDDSIDPTTGRCRTYASEIQRATQKRCDGMVRDECDLQLIDEAALASAYPLIEKHLGRRNMSFKPSGAVGTGTNAEGLATVFQPDFPVAPGRSILLEQDPNFPLHWRLGCLSPDFTWTEGEDGPNYKHLRITVWVAMRDSTFQSDISQPIGIFGEHWNEFQIIKGKDMYCDNCTRDVAINGPSGCPELDTVGREARILLQIDNLASADQPLTAESIEIKFAGFVEPCCDSCRVGKPCGGACKH